MVVASNKVVGLSLYRSSQDTSAARITQARLVFYLYPRLFRKRLTRSLASLQDFSSRMPRSSITNGVNLLLIRCCPICHLLVFSFLRHSNSCVRWADFNPPRGHEQAGLRPVLILTYDIFNERSRTVIAVAITGQPQRAGFPLTLELKTGDLPKRSWVKISPIRTLSVERIGKFIGRVSDEELLQVIEGLNEIIA